MDGEPDFVEHGCESKPDKAKNKKLTDYTSIGGCLFFWILFFRQVKKSISPTPHQGKAK